MCPLVFCLFVFWVVVLFCFALSFITPYIFIFHITAWSLLQMWTLPEALTEFFSLQVRWAGSLFYWGLPEGIPDFFPTIPITAAFFGCYLKITTCHALPLSLLNTYPPKNIRLTDLRRENFGEPFAKLTTLKNDPLSILVFPYSAVFDL